MTSNRNCARSVLLVTAFVSIAIGFAGCQGTVAQLSAEQLDERTGTTFWSAPEPMVFAREAGQYSRSARDYVYLGPVETNRQGTREYYLWVGIGSTIDRGFLAPLSGIPHTLFLFIRGELMEFKLTPWSDGIARVDPDRIYATNVSLQAQLVSRVTRDQLEVLAAEPLSAIRLVGEDERSARYGLWRAGRIWEEFLQHVGASVSIARSDVSPR